MIASPAPAAVRIVAGDYLALSYATSDATAGLIFRAHADVLYDNGESDYFSIDNFSPTVSVAGAFTVFTVKGVQQAKDDGWLYNAQTDAMNESLVPLSWRSLSIVHQNGKGFNLCAGWTYANKVLPQGFYQDLRDPAGWVTWVFQGTIAEDATAGTHVCTLTVTPGAGSEMQLNAGMIMPGNTTTAQTVVANVTDGTNILYYLGNVQDTAANKIRVFPSVVAWPANSNATSPIVSPIFISGAMQLILQVSTAAVSVTQTFTVVCRIKGAVPTATLADSVGTPTLTTNTNAVF